MRRRAFLLVVFGALTLSVGTVSSRPNAGSATRGTISFSGNGGRNLPPFRVRTPSTLVWTSSGMIFQTFSSSLGGGDVNAQSHSGWTYLPVGSYQLQVNTDAGWTIRVLPGVVRPKSIGNGLIGYRGNGGVALPPFTTHHGTNLVWACAGMIFQVFSADFTGGGDVNSQAHRGSSYMNAGQHTLTVNAEGNWTIGWKP